MRKVVVYEEPGIRWCQPLDNDWHLPALELRRQAAEQGIDLIGEEEAGQNPPDCAVYLDALLRPQHPPLAKTSLYISIEPVVVGAQERFYNRILGWPYTRILTHSRKHVDEKKTFYSPVPVPAYPLVTEKSAATSQICAITANKQSAHPRQLYSARKDIYRSIGKQLDLWGALWDGDPITREVNYRGRCKHNYETYKMYTQATCIENVWSEGFASEKYWTPLRAGCTFAVHVGWKPDYSFEDTNAAWAAGIVRHLRELIQC